MISLVALALAFGSSKPLDSDSGSDCEASDWYEDGDGDGWGGSFSGSSCLGPVGHVSVGGDCDDADSSVHPSATDDCDGLDQDCDGLIDEEGPSVECWGDSDGDSFGSDLEPSSAKCVCPDGSSAVAGDCDDEDPSVHPGAEEICSNGVDDDCDGLPGRCGTEGEVDWSYATDVIVGADDAEVWYLGGTLASGSSGSRNLIMQRLGVASKGSEVLNQNTMVVVDLGVGSKSTLAPRVVASITGESPSSYRALQTHQPDGAELDGDGVEDLIVGWSVADVGTYRADDVFYLVPGPVIGEIWLPDHSGFVVPEGWGEFGAGRLLLVDVGEGSFTVVASNQAAGSGPGRAVVFLSELDFEGERDPTEVPALWLDDQLAERVGGDGHGPLGPDLDGDGIADLVFDSMGGSDDAFGVLHSIFLGPLRIDLALSDADAWFGVEGTSGSTVAACPSEGREAVIVVQGHSDSEPGPVQVLGWTGSGSLSLEEHATVTAEEFSIVRTGCGLDMDADGQVGLVLSRASPSELYPGEPPAMMVISLPSEGAWDAVDRMELLYRAEAASAPWNSSQDPVLPPRDLDGDGFHDLVFVQRLPASSSSGSFSSNLLFFPGGDGGL